MEATGHWYWIIDEMERTGHRPHLANPHESKKRMGKPNKHDTLDAVVSLFCCTTERKIRRMGLPIRRTVGQAFGAQPGRKPDQSTVGPATERPGIQKPAPRASRC